IAGSAVTERRFETYARFLRLPVSCPRWLHQSRQRSPPTLGEFRDSSRQADGFDLTGEQLRDPERGVPRHAHQEGPLAARAEQLAHPFGGRPRVGELSYVPDLLVPHR